MEDIMNLVLGFAIWKQIALGFYVLIALFFPRLAVRGIVTLYIIMLLVMETQSGQ